MIKFDNEFWESIDATGFSAEQKKEFEAEVVHELEIRIGTEISEGMAEYQIEEFEMLNKGEPSIIADWLVKNHPGYTECKEYLHLKQKGYDDEYLLYNLATMLWLQTNKPDYTRIVNDQSDIVFREIMTQFGAANAGAVCESGEVGGAR